MPYTPWTRYTIGVEMEMNTRRRTGGSLSGEQIAEALRGRVSRPVTGDGSRYGYSSGEAWDVKYDSSAGHEVASPALRFDADGECAELRAGCEALGVLNPAINERCGLHVSIFMGRDYTWKNLQQLVSLWAQFEANFFAILPDSRQSNHYCQPLRESAIFSGNSEHWANTQRAINATTEREFQAACTAIGKYASVKLSDWWLRGRVEFRLHSGTISYDKIRNFVLVLCAMVERVKAPTVNPAAPAVRVKVPRPSQRQRKGFTNKYLFQQLGLTEGGWCTDLSPMGATLMAYMQERRARFLAPRARRAGVVTDA